MMRSLQLIFFLGASIVWLLPFTAFGQNAVLERKVNFHLQGELSDVLEQITEQEGIGFSYSKRRIPVKATVRLQVENKSLKEALGLLFENLPINFSLIEGQIVLTPVKEPEPAAPAKYTVSGYIKDKISGEVLIGATVQVEELSGGTITNPYGFFSLTLPEADYHLGISYIGFEKKNIVLKLDKNRQLQVELGLDTAFLQEIVIDSRQQISMMDALDLNISDIHPVAVQKMPALMGEEDVIKSLQAIPGIKSYSDGSVQFHVRGGAKDQNLILVDGAPIYNPAHSLGIFSTFVPEAVKDIKFYKGNMPVHLGGRVSSVIDVRTKEGNMRQFGMQGSVGLVSTKLAVEGPIKKDKSSYFLSYRRSHIQSYVQKVLPELSDFYFYDLNAKVNFRTGEKNRYFLTLYSGEDMLSENEEFGIKWGNVAATFRWNHIYNEKLFSNTTIYTSKYDYFLITSLTNDQHWNSHIANASIKSDYTWFAHLDHTLRFGLELRGHNFNPGNFSHQGIERLPGVPYVSKKNAREAVLYASNEHKIGKKLQLDYGFRLVSWQNVGESFEYIFDEAHQPVDSLYFENGQKYHAYNYIEPRLGIKAQLDSTSSLKFSYARTSQNIHQVSNSISPFTNLEVWLPSGPNIKPQRADMMELGYFRQFSKGWSLSLELYYKRLYNQIAYKEHANLLLNPQLEGELRFGQGRAKGLELLLKKNTGKLTGWLGYTWSKTVRRIEGVNQGVAYPARYDRPHELNLNLVYKPSRRWEWSAYWTWASGAAITIPTAFYQQDGYVLPYYGAVNNDRLPDYHRMDLAVEFKLHKKNSRYRHSLKAALFNAYGQKNPIYINFNQVVNEQGQLTVPSNHLSGRNYTATQTYLYRLIPSLSYNFKL